MRASSCGFVVGGAIVVGCVVNCTTVVGCPIVVTGVRM